MPCHAMRGRVRIAQHPPELGFCGVTGRGGSEIPHTTSAKLGGPVEGTSFSNEVLLRMIFLFPHHGRLVLPIIGPTVATATRLQLGPVLLLRRSGEEEGLEVPGLT